MVFSVRLSHLFSCDQAALRMAISVCLSVCLWHLFDNVTIIVSSWNFQELLPVTKFGYLLYWDIMGAPRHIPGQALLCVNIGNGWNSVCNNCFNYSNLYWVKFWVIWINSEFEFKYIRLIIRYWFCSTVHYLGDEIYSGARFECWRQAGSVLLYSERGAWRVKLMYTGMSSIKVFL